VNVALPDLAKDLGLSGGRLGWAITSYSLVFGSLLLLGGRAADVLGRRRLFLAGLGVFTVSSLASALAGSASVFFAARRPGAGRRDALARRALDHHRHLPGSRAHQGARRLGRGGRRGRGGRGAARRDAHGVARLASDLLDQPPGWRRRRRRHPARGGARHRSSAVARARPARCGPRHDERGGDRLRALAGRRRGMDVGADARPRARRPGRPGRVRRPGDEHDHAAARRLAAPRAGSRRRLPDDAHRLVRALRHLPPHLDVPPERPRQGSRWRRGSGSSRSP